MKIIVHADDEYDAGRLLPRAIGVGDTAIWCNGPAKVKVEYIPTEPDHLGNTLALVRDASRELFIVPLSELTPAPEETK